MILVFDNYTLKPFCYCKKQGGFKYEPITPLVDALLNLKLLLIKKVYTCFNGFPKKTSIKKA